MYIYSLLRFNVDPKEGYRTGSGSCPVDGLCIIGFEAFVSSNKDLCYLHYWSCSFIKNLSVTHLAFAAHVVYLYVRYFGIDTKDLLSRIPIASFTILSSLRFVATQHTDWMKL